MKPWGHSEYVKIFPESNPLQAAIDRLARLLEYGELQAATDLAGFINHAAVEIERLRAKQAAREQKGVQPGSLTDPAKKGAAC